MKASVEVGLLASELASNAARHGGGGTLWVVPDGEGVAVVCRDRGPGIADVEVAMADGWSSGRARSADDPPRGGLGTGLGAVRRLAEWVSFHAPAEGGLVVVAFRGFSRSRAATS